MTVALPQPTAGSDWTTETLRQHMLELIAARDRALILSVDALHRELAERDLRYQQRYDASVTAMDAALEAAEKAVQVAMISAEKAVNKAESAANERFSSVNEFRAQLSDQALTFMPRSEAAVQFTSLLEKIEALAELQRRDMAAAREMADRLSSASDERVKVLEAGAANFQGRLWALGTVIALVIIAVNIAIRFV